MPIPSANPPLAIVLMGVAGAGKTAVGEALAARLGVPFLDGDDFHPAANVARMAAGVPLDDADREPWLDAVADAINKAPAPRLVVACSALKRSYRERLSERVGRPLVFILLDASRETLARRLAARRGHFMPASLLDSQLKTLERPGPSERAIVVSAEPSPVEVAKIVMDTLSKAFAA